MSSSAERAETARVMTLAGVLALTIPVAAAPAPQGPLPAAPVMQLDERPRHPVLDASRFSLAFDSPRPIIEVLRILFAGTGMTLVPQAGLDQTFIGDLNALTLREALDLVTDATGLDYRADGNVVRVFVRELETRLYSVDRVIARSAAGGIDPPDVLNDLETGVRSLLSRDGVAAMNRSAGLLQVTDRASRFARIEPYVELAILRALRQVQIEARFIEIELRDEYAAGLNWDEILAALAPVLAPAPVVRTTPSVGGGLMLREGELATLLTALARQGVVRMLTSPSITAMNNEPVIIRSGVQGATFEGVALNATAQIAADGIITANIRPSVTGLAGPLTTNSDDRPAPGVRDADTVVRLRDGETMVMAGLIQDRRYDDTAGVPVLGGLFRRTDTRFAKTDLVILFTPRIIRPGQAGGVPRGGPGATQGPLDEGR